MIGKVIFRKDSANNVIFMWMIKAIASGILAILILDLFCLIYNYGGAHVKCETGATDYAFEGNQISVNRWEGFSCLQLDENGYNNHVIMPESGVDILLLGSSHMEALQVSENENTGYLLNQMCPEIYTYNIGMGNHDLYRCVNNIHDAFYEFLPKKYVIIEASTIELDLEDMRRVLNCKFEKLQPYNNVFQKIAKYCPVSKAVYLQLINMGLLKKSNSKINKTSCFTSVEYKQVLDDFLGMAVAPLKGTDIKLIIVAHPMTELDRDGRLILKTDPNAEISFSESCENNGIIFVSMKDDFRKLYEKEKILPYGFINTEVGKGHLNKYGHKVIAERLFQTITLLEQEED